MHRIWCLMTILASIAAAAGCTGKSPYHGEKLPAPESFNAHFDDMDVNGDDVLSWKEFRSYFPRSEAKIYAALDLNKDGFLGRDEWHQFKAAHGLEPKEQRGNEVPEN